MIPEYNTGGIVIPSLDGVLGPITSQALNMSRLANIVKTMQMNTVGMVDSFQDLRDGFMKLGNAVSEATDVLEKDVPPTTEEVRLGKANLARIVKNRG